ncbi:hypothetical protein A7985_13535 [Pseudoalteromonas luteoviolacea]|uniref:Peptidase M1 membrane alanine aminopeptidase domain-containing protein n=1 Tax=Pseudoalteromonas luteoviolacea TaxID=43657 RepID=A0A1C0TPL4_9GAMM|nr:M1 family aminopeptidase [Pseudoalteromonas luteoviolacea]OCQ20815.1 hypothetical protein A7985_13535 [Pseudoalteromonas luteoviolacea]
MFINTVRFELFTIFSRWMVYVLALLLVSLSAYEVFEYGTSYQIVPINAPYTYIELARGASIILMVLTAIFVGRVALSNHTYSMQELIFCRPINPWKYHIARVVAVYFVIGTLSCLTVIMNAISAYIGWKWSLLSYDVVGPFQWRFVVSPLVLIMLPNALFYTLLFYAISIVIKSQRAVAAVSMALVVATALLFAWAEVARLDESRYMHEWLMVLDMSALSHIVDQTVYWSASDKQTQTLGLEPIFLLNRVFWLIATLAVFIGAIKISLVQKSLAPYKRKDINEMDSQNTYPEQGIHAIESLPSNIWFFYRQLKFEVLHVAAKPSFWFVLGLSVFLTLWSPMESSYGTPLWRLTYAMIEHLGDVLLLPIFMVLLFYCPELIWRERESRAGAILECYPIKNWLLWSAKFIAALFIVMAILAVSVVASVKLQLDSGIEAININQYLFSVGGLHVFQVACLLSLTFFVHAISLNRATGTAAMAVLLLAFQFTPPMLSFANSPPLTYSDLNGYGQSIAETLVYFTYWGSLSVILAVLGYLLWPRGESTELRTRLSFLPQQLSIKDQKLILLSSIMFVAAGSHIFYHSILFPATSVLDVDEDVVAAYEHAFISHRNKIPPVVQRVDIHADVYPKVPSIKATAKLSLLNSQNTPVDKMIVNSPLFMGQWKVESGYGKLKSVGLEVGSWFVFNTPLQPGETADLEITVELAPNIYDNVSQIVENGTFINNKELFPFFGYDATMHITDPEKRSEYGLKGEVNVVNDIDDSTFHTDSLIGEAVTFRAELTTDADQLALAPGVLTEHRIDGDRAKYTYTMKQPMVNYYSIQSFKLKVKRDRHKGVDLQIHYHPDHQWNIDTMMEAAKDSLDYFSNAFGPYQYSELRIIEFPRYRKFAQSFANTIPFSEDIGFRHDTRRANTYNMPYYITAHEVAHQWWGHQLIAANVEGADMLIESLAEYSALKVVAQRYYHGTLRQYKKYALDHYLTERGRELEYPLYITALQGFVHYEKGALAMLALAHSIGESKLNQLLKKFIEEQRVSSKFATTNDLIALINEHVDSKQQALVHDLFHEITFYSLRVDNVVVGEKNTETGRYPVTITIDARKFYADEYGKETEAELDDLIEVALVADSPEDVKRSLNEYHRQDYPIKSGLNTILIEAYNPFGMFVVVDPYMHRIDKNSKDNFLQIDYAP